MSDIIFGVSIGLIVFFLVLGFLIGLIRGVKRSALHIVFVIVSILVAFFITRPVVNVVLGIVINVDGSMMTISDYILSIINENIVDLSNFDSASAFIRALPSAVASPIIFMVLMILVYFVIDIIYLIIARIAFGKKKKDLQQHKAHRLPGGLVGIMEACLFVFVLFAPITSLTNTYSEIVEQSTVSAAEVVSYNVNDSNHLQTIGSIVSTNVPDDVGEAIDSFNKSAIGRLCSIGGINNKLFDGLSSIKVNGEKIHIREEIVSVANSYNSFVVLYNNIIDENYTNLKFSDFKNSVKFVIQNNLFKTVIADTIGDFVVNFEQIGGNLTNNLPDIAKNIITTLQTKFSSENFDAYDYISNDLMKLLDIADTIISSGKLNEFINFNELNGNIGEILNMFTKNSNLLSTSLINFADLNLVNDTLPIILDYVNQSIQTKFENDQDIVVAFNTNISNQEFKNTITTLFSGENSILSQINELEQDYNILDILKTDNVLDSILKIENVDIALTKFGAILDDINELELLSYTNHDTDENVRSFENMLKLTGIDVLGDTVSIKVGETQQTEILNSYEEFFTYISKPIRKIIDTGLVDLLNEDVDFNIIVDTLTSAISGTQDSDKDLYFLADILMPFYELEQANFAGQSLKELVFTNITNLLNENLSEVINLSTTSETENYQTWENRLISVASLIDTLNDGEMLLGNETKTYLKYILSVSPDYFNLIKNMNNDNTIKEMLDIIFSNSIYQPLNNQIFSIIDNQIANFTTVHVNTNIDNLYTEKESYINLITSMISYLDEGLFDSEDLTTQLTAIGQILNDLKTYAQQDVFDEIFANLIWYMTGEVIDENNANSYFGKITPFEYADKTKEYLDADKYDNGYYGIDYLAEVEGLVDFIEFGNQVVQNLNQVDLSTDDGRIQFVQNLEKTIEDLGDNAQEVINTAKEIVQVVLSEEQLSKIQAQSENMKIALNNYESESGVMTEEIKSSLLELFGLN